MTDKFLVLKLDQYAGNVDEIVCTALTGGGFERYGGEQARAVFQEKVKPFLEDPDEEYPMLPVEFCHFATEYGHAPYALDGFYTNNLRLGLDTYCSSSEDLRAMFDIWDRAYGDEQGNLEIVVEGIHGKSVTVKILGFDLVEVQEVRTTLR